MKFVNTQSRIIYRSAIGNVNPGATTSDKYKDLEICLQKVIGLCGKDFRIVLNEKEAQLIAKLMELDNAGSRFDPSVIPAEVRRDPTGIKRILESDRQKQHAHIEAVAKANKDAADREAMINGEVVDKPKIQPLGVNRNAEEEKKGMTGFEQILAENARIAEQKAQEAPVPKPADPAPEPKAGEDAPQAPTPAKDEGDDATQDTKDAKKPASRTRGRGRARTDAQQK